MAKETEQQQNARLLALEQQMRAVTAPLIGTTMNPGEALGVLSLYTKNMACAILVGSGMPVTKNINVLLKKIALIPNLKELEDESMRISKKIAGENNAKASIVDMNGNKLK